MASISNLLENLGFEVPSRHYDAAKNHISSFLKKTVNIHMASDEELREAAHEYLHDAENVPGWLDKPDHMYRWSVQAHQQQIETTIFRVMQLQQGNFIHTVHRKHNPCPGCRSDPTLHGPSRTASLQPDSPVQPDIPQVTSDIGFLPPQHPRRSRPSFHGKAPPPIAVDIEYAY